MNQLTILGGSSAGVGTGQGCSSYLVAVNQTRLVLDMGPNTLLELRKHTDFRTLDAIIISHLHLDHVLDLFALRFILSYNPVKARRRIPLFLPPGGLAYMAKAADLFATEATDIPEYFSAVFDMREYEPTDELRVGSATVTFAPTVHLIPCWAIRIHPDQGVDLVYTADTGRDADLDGFAKDAAVIIADSAAPASAPDLVKRTVHYDAAAAAELAARAGCDHLVLSHQWEEHDPAKNAAIASEHFQGQISIATPGLVVTW